MACCCLGWCAKEEPSSRTVWVGQSVASNVQQFPPNVIRNQKYSIFSFIPVVSEYRLNKVVLLEHDKKSNSFVSLFGYYLQVQFFNHLTEITFDTSKDSKKL